MQEVVTRVSNRVYVGLPLCQHYSCEKRKLESTDRSWLGRNREYIRLVMKFTSDVVRDRTTGFFNLVPDSLK